MKPPDPDALADLEDWDDLGLNQPYRSPLEGGARDYALIREAVALFRAWQTREWGRFRPGVSVVPITDDQRDQVTPPDRLMWRLPGADYRAWVDAETGIPLGSSATWPPEDHHPALCPGGAP